VSDGVPRAAWSGGSALAAIPHDGRQELPFRPEADIRAGAYRGIRATWSSRQGPLV